MMEKKKKLPLAAAATVALAVDIWMSCQLAGRKKMIASCGPTTSSPVFFVTHPSSEKKEREREIKDGKQEKKVVSLLSRAVHFFPLSLPFYSLLLRSIRYSHR